MNVPVILPAVEVLTADQVAAMDQAQWQAAHRDGLSASEIAAVMGLSPWESPFALHWRKRGGWDGVEETLQMRAGKALEPLITAEFQAAHPELTIVDCGMFAHSVRTWQLATPDRIAWGDDLQPIVIEEKTAESADGWGDTGTTEVPIHYYSQLQWQMDVLHARRGVLVVMIGHREIREYPIAYDGGDTVLMRNAGLQFLDDVRAGIAPDLDGHPATGKALRKLHPELEDREVEIPDGLAMSYLRTKRLADRVEAHQRHVEHRLREVLGSARRGMHDGQRLVSRSMFERRSLDGKELRAAFQALADAHPRSRIAAEFLKTLDEHTNTTTVDRLFPATRRKATP